MIVSAILFFGLWLKGNRFSNGAAWLTDKPGIRFANYGLAYTPSLQKLSDIDHLFKDGFSIELAIRPAARQNANFGFVLCLHGGQDRDQLLLWQWRSHVIVMNGDDYSHKRREPRISINTESFENRPIFLNLTSGQEGTRIWINRNVAKTDVNLKLSIPNGGGTRLTLGNSVYGNNPWEGDVMGLAVYELVLNEEETAQHFSQWTRSQSFRFAAAYQPLLLYTFESGPGGRVLDRSGNGLDLLVPPKMMVLQKRFLAFPWEKLQLNPSLISDVVVNLLGFIPLGLVMAILLHQSKGFWGNHAMAASVLFCFLLSLGIEITQAWMPWRSSDLHDLLLNTAGGWIGTVTAKQGMRYKELGLT